MLRRAAPSRQSKGAFSEAKHAFVAHPAELRAHGAAVDGEEIRELLPVERDREGIAPRLLRHQRKVAHQLLARGALLDMAELRDEAQVRLRQGEKQVADDLIVERARGGAGRQHPFRVEEDNGRVLYRDDVVHYRLPHEIRLPEELPDSDPGDYAPVAPVIVRLHEERAVDEHRNALDHFPLAEHEFAFLVTLFLRAEAGEHPADLFLAHVREKLRSFQNINVFFHKKLAFVVNTTDFMLG